MDFEEAREKVSKALWVYSIIVFMVGFSVGFIFK